MIKTAQLITGEVFLFLQYSTTGHLGLSGESTASPRTIHTHNTTSSQEQQHLNCLYPQTIRLLIIRNHILNLIYLSSPALSFLFLSFWLFVHTTKDHLNLVDLYNCPQRQGCGRQRYRCRFERSPASKSLLLCGVIYTAKQCSVNLCQTCISQHPLGISARDGRGMRCANLSRPPWCCVWHHSLTVGLGAAETLAGLKYDLTPI